MADQYVVVPEGFFSAIAILGSEQAAIEAAANAVDRDKKVRLIVQVRHLVRPRNTPNVDVVPVPDAQVEQADG